MRKLTKLLTIGALGVTAIVGLGVIVNALLISTTRATLERRIESLRDAGDPVTLADLVPKPGPPEQDAATWLNRAAEDLDKIDKELANVYSSESYDTGRLSDQDHAAVASAFEAYPDAIRLLKRAAACPRYDPQLATAQTAQELIAIARAASIRKAARLLRAHSLLMLAQGDNQQAMQSALDLLRFARLSEKEPMLIGYLVAAACRGVAVQTAATVLRAGEVLPQDRAALEEELARHDPMDALVRALKTERVVGLDALATSHPYAGNWLTRTYVNGSRIEYLNMMERQIKLVDQPFSEARSAPADANYTPPVQMVVPAVQAAHEAAVRTLAFCRCLRVLNAVQGRALQPGEPPLAQLELPPEATTDPFNGESLRLRETSQGWLIYSVGRDMQDNGGDLDSLKDVGLAP